MKILNEFALLLFILLFGELLADYISIPIPGSILGMGILLVLLIIGIVKEDDLKHLTDFILGNFAFFFIPAGVGLINVYGNIEESLVKILVLLTLSTVIVIISTGLTVQFLRSVMNKHD